MYARGLLDARQKHFWSAIDFDKYINHEVKVKPAYSWINQCGSKARKKSLVNAETAFQRFFHGRGGFPRFKKKSRQDVKLYFPKNNAGDWTIHRHKLQIPTLKDVRLKEYGYLPEKAKIKNGTVSYTAGRYYVCVTAEINEKSVCNKDLPICYQMPTEGVGIDLGIKELAIVSNGKIFRNINKDIRMRNLDKKLRREQRGLSRKYEEKKKRGEQPVAYSANIKKQKLAIQKIYQRQNCIRMDYENKVVHAVVKQKPSFITLEDLNVKGMMKNKHLAKAVSKQRFFCLKEKLLKKSKIIGIEIRIADRFYPSSKRCHACGNIDKELRLSDRIYVCPVCGYTEDRDVNASLNLRDAKEYRRA